MNSYDRAHLEACLPWATPAQRVYVEKIIEVGSVSGAAKALDRHHSTLQDSMASLKLRAAAQGVSLEHNMRTPVPDPFIVKGQSMLERVDPVTGDRQKILEWTKTRIDDEVWIQAIKDGVAAFVAEQEPIEITTPVPEDVDTDVIPWLQIGDAHLGMLAHEAETGANFDLKIAETELTLAVAMMIDKLPYVERMVINDLGDFTHYENMAGVTEASGHALDLDGRFPKMIKVYSRLMRAMVERALTKAQHVDVIVNQGNHSRTNDIWMAELLRVAYEHTGRVHVLNNDNPFIGYRMGRTFVMTHHSDKCKPDKLANVMATDFRRDWGEAEYCYIDIGHIHHRMASKEHPGVMIESWNILAPKDKWAHDGGYRSRSSMSMVLRSRTYGEIGRHTLPVRAVQDRIRKLSNPAHYVAPEKRAHTV